MNVFLKIKGFICLLFAIGTLIIPGTIAPLYGMSLTFTAMYFVNLFGVCFLGLGLICLVMSASEGSDLKRSIMLSLAITDTVGFGFMLYHQLTGAINGLGWTTVALWLLFAAGCWSFYRKKA